MISNSIVHHIPDPRPAFAEMARLVAGGGTVFVRDLARPRWEDDVQRIVATYAARESPRARALFADSLRAALTLEEAQAMVQALGGPPQSVTMTSDRHWTWSWSP